LYAVFGDAGFRPAELSERLLCVIFGQQHEFADYARQVDRVDMSWSRGYYSARTNRIAIFDERTAAVLSRGLAPREPTTPLPPTDSVPADAAQLVLRTGPSDPPDTTARRLVERSQEGARIAALNTAKTAHEAAHQLAFNSGLQKRGVMYPLWVAEGLATSFEPADLDAPFGPGEDNPSRRRHLIEAAQAELLPLSEFVVLTRVPKGGAQMVVEVYAQAWGLFHFLFTTRPAELRAYMAALAALEPGARDEGTLRREFVDAFGALPALQAAWDEYVAGMR
jgi:hypothetical protein